MLKQATIVGSFMWLHENDLFKQNGLCLNPYYVVNHKELDIEVSKAVEIQEPFTTRPERAKARRDAHDRIYLAKAIRSDGKPYTVSK